MDTKLIVYITIFVIMCSSATFGIMLNNNIDNSSLIDLSTINNQKVVSINDINKTIILNNKINYITNKTGLTKEEAEFLINECNKKDLNIFLVIGLIKLESNFNANLVGTSGERGLGQLMLNTAEALAENLNIEYSPEYLFEPKYNIKLFTTHLRYLKKYYDNDIHKTLTAYNRGQYGLKKYMASRSRATNRAISIYSRRVLEHMNYYYKQYLEEYKLDTVDFSVE